MADYPAVSADRHNLVGYRQTVLGDYVRPWMYQIVVPPVQNGGNSRVLTALSRSLSLPGYTVKEESISYQGLNLKVASVAQFDGKLDLTILASHTHDLFQRFMEWSAAAYEPGHMYSAAPDSYKVDNVLLHQLDRAGKTVMTWKLYGAWCSSVKPWNVSQNETTPSNFTASISYDFFTFSAASNEGTPHIADTTKTGIDSAAVALAQDAVNIASGNNLNQEQKG